jgi:hypothetical protein
MENGETPEKDYFINAGENDGLKRGMLVMVNRRQALYDQYQNKSPGDLVVIVGQLRIIHVQGEISVARLEKLMSRDNMPTLDFDAVMMGDKVDLNTAKMAPQKTASIETPLPQETVIPAAPQIVPTVVPSVPALAPAGKAEFSSMAPQAPVPSGTSL